MIAGMIIERASVLGMCVGVRRAQSLAQRAARDGRDSGRPVFTYGPLIHNPQAVLALESEGVRVLDPEAFESGRLDAEAAGAIVVIRAHGAPPEAFARLKSLGADAIDATCPRVLSSQRRARALLADGWLVAIAGDRSHGEVTGIVGHAPGAEVVQNPEEAAELAQKWAGKKVALIAQTTIKTSEYEAIAARFAALCPDLLSEKTLCPATEDRQEALAELARRVDAIVVVGGKNSANTRRLATAAREAGLPCFHIETAAELPDSIFGFGRVGLTAGASTPDFMVDEVERFLLSGKA